MKNQNRGFKKKFIPNTETVLKMFLGGECNKRQYDVDSLVDVLHTIPFEKISYPVIASKKALFSGDVKGGTIQVGYVRAVKYEEDVMFEVTIYAKSIKAIEASMPTPIIFPNVRVSENGDIEKVISFEIVNETAAETEE